MPSTRLLVEGKEHLAAGVRAETGRVLVENRALHEFQSPRTLIDSAMRDSSNLYVYIYLKKMKMKDLISGIVD